MATLLDELRVDHVNMLRLLELLERQLAVFRRGDTPDYDLIAAVVDYCRTYPDRYHHPKEDALLEALREQAPTETAGLHVLTREHEELSGLTLRLAEVTDRVLQDLEVPRQQLDAAAREFIDAYRRHIAWEDAELLPRLDATLGGAELRQVERQLQAVADPLFGDAGQERFKVLRRQLLRDG